MQEVSAQWAWHVSCALVPHLTSFFAKFCTFKICLFSADCDKKLTCTMFNANKKYEDRSKLLLLLPCSCGICGCI